MIQSAFPLFFLRKLPWSRFDFPRWQAWAALVLTAALWGLVFPVRSGLSLAAMPAWSLAIAVASSMVTTLVYLAAVLGFLGWWMQREGRWNGQGSMLNLIAASWLVTSLLGAGLVAAGMPLMLVWPLWFYSAWIVGNALSGAMPKASLAYSMYGVLAISIAGLILQDITMNLSVFALTALSEIA